MHTYHIHIEGQVQGVGFRPFVYRKATENGLRGWVSNGIDGVHIEVTGEEDKCFEFYHQVLTHKPEHARILRYSIKRIELEEFTSFTIAQSNEEGDATLLLTPDIGICKQCKHDIVALTSRRFHYPFTTCTQCGPRYSIKRKLPYDRQNTSMKEFKQCLACHTEYNNVWDRRYYSQTNACLDCGVTVTFTDSKGTPMTSKPEEVVVQTGRALLDGKIVAMKGIGGYLLLCNARNADAIMLLRQRKHRPSKPFAVLYPSLIAVRHDAYVSDEEEAALTSPQAPVVLLTARKDSALAMDVIAPGLNTLGVMLPYSGLMVMLMEEFQQPVVATSGNDSGSPIYYKDDDAFKYLGTIADYFITHNLELAVPQDDSVVRYTRDGHRIMIRRSRGLAPTFLPNPLHDEPDTWLAMGCDLKNTFSLLHRENVYVSQYLGDLSSYTTFESFLHVLKHLESMLQAKPARIIIDKHPGYFSSNLGRELAEDGIPLSEVQHHKAHFHAVLAENNLHQASEPILGVIWDGAGLGEDDNIWGGEFMLYEEGSMNRIAHLPYIKHMLADKFSREPRLAALSMFHSIPGALQIIKDKFAQNEIDLYINLLQQDGGLYTSSMGRLFDAVACLLGVCDVTSYEGEAAMKIESLATAALLSPHPDLKWFTAEPFSVERLIANIINGLKNNIPAKVLAFNFHVALVDWIDDVATSHKIHSLAFSGGVFQNALLVQLIREKLANRYVLYFHHQLSSNDECISFGQLAAVYYEQRITPDLKEEKHLEELQH